MEAQRRQVIPQSCTAFHKASLLLTDCYKHARWAVSTNGRHHGEAAPHRGQSKNYLLGRKPARDSFSISLPGSVWLR